MTLTLDQGHRSRSNFPKMGKKLKNWLGTKVQPIKAHWMTQVPMTKGQIQISRSNEKKNLTII